MELTVNSPIGALVAVVLVLALTLLARSIGAWITWIRDIVHLRSLPSPPKRWIIGHSRELGFGEKTMQYCQKNQQKYPKLCVYWIGPFLPLVTTSDVEAMKQLFLRPEEPKSMVYNYLIPWIGVGLLLLTGEKWKRHRRMLTPAFHLDILKGYLSVFNEVSNNLIEIWTPIVRDGRAIDITDYTSRYTLDALLRCIYSIDSNCLDGKGESVEFLKATHQMTCVFMKRVHNPLYSINWIFNLSPLGHQHNHYCDVIHKFSNDVILKRRQELLKGTQSKRKQLDFLDILLSAKDDDGVGLTDTEIRDEVDTFMFAGHDTTAAALGWCLYCMAKYKEHQDLCRKEVREILAGRDSDELTMQDVSKLVYTTMCIKEALRIFTPVPNIAKTLTEDIIIDGFRIPKGTWVELGLMYMHHDPNVWDDPEKFDPRRFNIENSKDRNPFQYLPFAAGKRNCVGQQFALLELKVTLAHLFNKFEFEVEPGHVIERSILIVLKSGTGIKLKINEAP